MHCSGFEVNNKPRDLASALFFIYKKKKKNRPQAILFIHKGNNMFPQTSAYFASLFSSILIISKFLRKTPFYEVGIFFSAFLLIL